MKYAWAKATAQAFAMSDGEMRAVSCRYPVRLRLHQTGPMDWVMEIDRDLKLEVTTDGYSAEVRFYLKADAPVMTMGINGSLFIGSYVSVRQ